MIEVRGGFELPIAASTILNFLQQPKNFSQCLPNLQEFSETDQNSFQAAFKVEVPQSFGVSYLQNLSVRMNFVTSNVPDGTVLKGEGRSAGIKMRLSLSVRVVPKGESSKLEYDGYLDAGLVEKLLGKQRLESLATDISKEIMDCISKKLQNS